LIIGGIFAAILSTADSQLLVVASTLVRDIYEKILKKGTVIPEARKLKLSRWVVVLSGVVALVMAYLAQDLIFWLVLFAWGGLGAAFGTSLIFALYWKRTTTAGVLAGMITGTLVIIFWKLYLSQPTQIYELIPGFICASLAVVIGSLLSRKA
jgi:Na+/proline symporter